MRDGKRLFTSIYVPKDTSRSYPFLMTRTPYSVAPYGVDQFRTRLGPSEAFDRAGYIFVFQDVRGRYLSEGDFVEMRPHIDTPKRNTDVDESTDTYDTVEWLLKNVANHNGRVGIWGISYPGFYTSASIIDNHPAIKAASPQAPMTDLFMGDDSYHNGAFMLAANFSFYTGFKPRPQPTLPARGSPAVRVRHQRRLRLLSAHEAAAQLDGSVLPGRTLVVGGPDSPRHLRCVLAVARSLAAHAQHHVRGPSGGRLVRRGGSRGTVQDVHTR